MSLDLFASQRPALGAPVIETIPLADFDAVQVRAIRHRPPADCKVCGNQRRKIAGGIVLARQYPHRRAEIGARTQQEDTALDARRSLDDVLQRLGGGKNSRWTIDVAL